MKNEGRIELRLHREDEEYGVQTVVMTFPEDLTLGDVVDRFKAFLLAVGYTRETVNAVLGDDE